MTGIVKGTYILNLYVDCGKAWIAVDEAELKSVDIDYRKHLSAASKKWRDTIFLSVPEDSAMFFEALMSKNTCERRRYLGCGDQIRELPENYLQDAVFLNRVCFECGPGEEAIYQETAEEFWEEFEWLRSCGQARKPNA